MSGNGRRPDKHIGKELLERIAIGRGDQLPSGASEHLDTCHRCRREASELRELHAALIALAPLRPAAGFAGRVMSRVCLPIPRRVRVARAMRAHWLATSGVVAGTTAAFAAGLALTARYPEVTPWALATFLLDRSLGLVWTGVMAIGRLVYESGLLVILEEIMEQLTVSSALLTMATLTLVGMGALRIMLRLMDEARDPAQPVIGG
jgi:hypothetical protein